MRTGCGAALFDYNHDGDLDLVIVNVDLPPTVLENVGGNARSWLTLDLRPPPGRNLLLNAKVRSPPAGRPSSGRCERGTPTPPAGSSAPASNGWTSSFTKTHRGAGFRPNQGGPGLQTVPSRGLDNVAGEWALNCTVHNLLKLAGIRTAPTS